MKAREGYVGYSESRKRYYARVTAIDPATGKRTQLMRFTTTKTEALKKKRELLNQLEKDGAESFAADRSTFAFLALKFKKEKLVPAVYVGETKIAGRRHLASPEAWLNQLRLFFDEYKLTQITAGEIRKFKVWLSKIPARSKIEEVDGKLRWVIKENGNQRGIEAINRVVEQLRTMLNYAVEEKLLRTEHNPFSALRGGGLIDKGAEKKRERFPTFGEELALLNFCNIEGRLGNAHLRPIVIVAADTGLRQNELFTLKDTDLDFNRGVIRVRAINAKTNRPRQIPMTPRVKLEMQKLVDKNGPGFVFSGLKNVKRSYATACRNCKIEDLDKHDFRHGFVSRAILAGIPPAVALSASGHASDEWKRYLNMTPDQLQYLLEPQAGQNAKDVRTYAEEVMRGLREALKYDQVERLFGMPAAEVKLAGASIH